MEQLQDKKIYFHISNNGFKLKLDCDTLIGAQNEFPLRSNSPELN